METNATSLRKRLVAILMLVAIGVSGQVIPPLERTITVELSGNSLKEALKKMENEGRFSFAYRSSLIDSETRLSRTYIDKTSREILDDLFQRKLSYKEKGNYIILRSRPNLGATEIAIEGYVVDAATREKIPYVSIYDTISLASAVSDEYGYFNFKLKKGDQINIATRKVGYRDTASMMVGNESVFLNLEIAPLDFSEGEKKDSLGLFQRLRNMKFYKPSKKHKANLENFANKLSNSTQISLFPYVGTNGKLSSTTVVDYSFNVFGGITGGVRRLEVGGLFNMVWDSVSGLQAAGVFNSVAGPQTGLQFSGFSNINTNTFVGGQFSGFTNITLQGVKGLQASGFWNQAGDSSSVIQLAGFGNYVKGGNDGAQVAGFINVADDNFTGTQVAGFINVAKKIEGVQLGIINISDSINGLPIGVFSYANNGLHQLEVSSNEVMPLNLAFKSGTPLFYNTFMVGANPFNTDVNQRFWSYGYGIGSSVRVSGRSRLFFDLQTMNIQQVNQSINLSLLNKLTASYQFQLGRKLAIAAGPSFNAFIVDNMLQEVGQQTAALAPYNFYEHNFSRRLGNGDFTRLQLWVGGHLAFLFF